MAHSKIVTLVRRRRERTRLSQQELAERIGVSRQQIVTIEAGRCVPSTRIALQLARTLGCTVGELFELPPDDGVETLLAPCATPGTSRGERVALGRVADRWVAHRLPDDATTAADGIILRETADGQRGLVEPLCDVPSAEKNLLVAGCAPLLGAFAERARRQYRDGGMTWLSASTRRALALVREGLVHVAGMHLWADHDEGTGGWLREQLPGRSLVIVNLTRWRQGFVVPKGNPRSIRDGESLHQAGLRFARREPGSGADELLWQMLHETADPGREPSPPDGPLAPGHAEVAELVRCGAVDVGIAIEPVAIAAGLDFVPLTEERFDLVMPSELASTAPVSRVIEVLGERAFRCDAARLPGYDGSLSGQVEVLAAA